MPHARRRRSHAEQPADDLHRRRAELRRDHQPHSFRRRRIRLSSQLALHQSAEARQRRQRPARAHRRARQILRRLELRPDLRFRRHRRTALAAPEPSARAGHAGRLPAGRRHVRNRERLSQLHRPQAVRRQARDRRRHHGYPLHARRGDKLERHRVHGARVLRRHRAEYRRRRFPLRLRCALVHRHAVARRLCDGADHGRHPLLFQRHAQRHDRAGRRGRPRRGADRQRQRLLAPYRRRCRMADPRAAQSRSRARRR